MERLLYHVHDASRPEPTSDAPIKEAERILEAKQQQLENLVDSFARTGSLAIEKRLLALEAEVAAEQRKLDDMKANHAIKNAPPPDWLSDFASVVALSVELENPDDNVRIPVRVKVRQHLKSIIDSMVLHDDKTLVVKAGKNTFTFRYDGKTKPKPMF